MPPKGKKKKKDPNAITFRGVYQNKGMWKARVWHENEEIYLGHFRVPARAAEAYDMAVIRFRGPIGAAREGLNFPLEIYQVNGTVAQIMGMEADEFLDWVRQELADHYQLEGLWVDTDALGGGAPSQGRLAGQPSRGAKSSDGGVMSPAKGKARAA
ncbi:unnamed protein product [Pedinophyceae sp. YPF-701]|nr:unnamed protein product [Pedinophyceae sp. YPF-701]